MEKIVNVIQLILKNQKENFQRIFPLLLRYSFLSLVYWYLFFVFFDFENIFGLYLGFHILILDPFVTKLAEIKKWESLEIIHTLKDPRISKHIVTGLVYPYIFLLIFGLLRYYALGKNITPYYVHWDIEYFLYLLLFSFHIFLLLLKFKTLISEIKKKYLKDTNLISYSLHLYFLRNFYYRMTIEKIYKYWSAFYILVNKNSYIYPSWYKNDNDCANSKKSVEISRIRKILIFFYDSPQIFLFFVCLFVVIEVIYTKKIYYSSYLLFSYFFLDLIITGLYKIGRSYFIIDCCYSNYLNEESWENPYFPHMFASFCEDPNLTYTYTRPTVKEIPENVLSRLNELEVLAHQKIYGTKKCKNTYRKLRFAVLRTNANLFIRTKLAFQESNGGLSWTQHSLYAKNQKRFVHTGSSSVKLHPSTPFFFTKPIEKLALIKKAPNWVAVHTQIQMLERVKITQEAAPEYSPLLHPTIVEQQPLSVSIKELEEYNLITSFNILAEAGVGVSFHKEPYDSKTQPQPDMRDDFSTNTKYQNKLEFFEKVLENEGTITAAQKYALNLLKNCSDDTNRKDVWASVLHLFPLNRIPPINTEAMINDSNFTYETKNKFVSAEKEIETMSNRLHRDFPKQRNRDWLEMKQSAKELSSVKNPEFSVGKETLDMVIEFMSK